MDLFRELFIEAEPIRPTTKAMFHKAQVVFDAGRLEAAEGLRLIFVRRSQTLTLALPTMGLLKRALPQLRSPLP